MNNKENMIVAVVGLCGAGKTEATEIFIENNWKKVYFGDATFDEMKRQNLPINPENERKVRETLRAKNDMAIYAKLSAPKIDSYYKDGNNIVVESMYSWSEYKYLKEIYGNKFQVLSIVTDKQLRIDRLKNREYRPLNAEQVHTRDYTEIENIEKGGPVAIADHFICNNGSMEELRNKVQEYIDKLNK